MWLINVKNYTILSIILWNFVNSLIFIMYKSLDNVFIDWDTISICNI
jgi:hypothetical protein